MKRGDESAWRQLYKRIGPSVKSYLISKGCDEEKVQDFFQEAMISFWQNRNTLTLTVPIKTYVIAVCKHLCMKDKRRPPMEVWPADEEIEDLGLSFEESLSNEKEFTKRQRIAEECVKKLDDKCRAILQYFFFDDLSMVDIAVRVGLANARSAITAKRKCMRKLEECVEQNYREE